MEITWPFDQDKSAAALTKRQVLEEKYPILNVVHYSDDHSWALTCGTTDDVDDGKIVCMSYILELDATIATIADLEPGWVAYRKEVGEPWERCQDDEM